jgi:hypothetical protein
MSAQRLSCVGILLAACGGSSVPSEPDLDTTGGAPAIDAISNFWTNLTYDREQIQLADSDTITKGSVSYHRYFYRNTAYRCGRSGHFTFLVVEPDSLAGATAPMSVNFHGGGFGYYTPSGVYSDPANEWKNDENIFKGCPNAQCTALADVAGFDPAMRTVAVSMCDHDLYAGLGQIYPNNPHWIDQGLPPDTVDGALASMAAVHYVAKGNSTAPGYPTSYVYFHGSSAGGAGAYHVAATFARRGTRVNSVEMAAYAITTRTAALLATGCAGPDTTSASAAKITPFGDDASLFVDASFATAYALPTFFADGSSDPFCCGPPPTTTVAAAAGYTNDCHYVYGAIEDAIAAAPASAPPLGYCIGEGEGHGGGGATCAAPRSAWFDETKTLTPPPVFRNR